MTACSISYTAARLTGEAMAQRAEDAAARIAPDFPDAARAAILEYLDQHVEASGEDITDAVKARGIVPHDDRAFGAAYAALRRAGLIAQAGWTERRKGHGTGGARLWRRVGR